VHGANSRPQFLCENLFEALGPEPFIVCPHASSHLEWDACWGNGAPLAEAVDRAVQAAIETFGDRIDTRHLVFFGHSLGAMKIPDAYAFTRARRPFSAVVIFEGMPKDTTHLERAVRNLGATQALFVSGQDGWRGRHADAAASLARHGLFAWHVAGTFGHSFVGEAFDIVRREVPLLWQPSS
jgi:predicted esterase